jgi:hypothetical protein
MTLPALMSRFFTAFFFALTSVAGASEGTAHFESKIRPVLVQHCYKCHSEAEGERKGGLLLDRQSGWLDGGDSGQAIVPGDVEGSLFIKAIRYTDEDMQMPPKKQLPAETITLLEEWVRRGAHGPATDLGETEFSELGDQGKIFEKASTHWAFQPVKKPVPPVSEWSEHPVDQFIAHKLKEKNLTPSKRAPAVVLQRRLSLDLTGLPSEKGSVEDLLKSAHFGEHWARMWLDVSRYADTANVKVPASTKPAYYPYAFTFRDYVIDSFNADKPVDRFIKEQLAADLMGLGEKAPELAALGFLTAGPFINAPHDQIDDLIDVTTRGLMGITVACARCHDHKFEPVPTADYYSLYGVFGSIVKPQPDEFGEFPPLPGYEIDPKDRAAYDEARKPIEERMAQAKAAKKLVGARQPLNEVIRAGEMTELILFNPGAPARAMIVKEKPKPIVAQIFLRGEADTRGDRVPRRFLKLLDPQQPAFPEENSGRLALAEKIASKDNPLTARVFVNRVWGQLMGRYLVDSPSDFGLQGSAPTHPELLDWLAADFMEHGWSLKHLIKTIVSSKTYQQSSAHNEDAAKTDPTNQLYWSAHRKRLTVEQLRDSLLALSGKLDRTLRGRPQMAWEDGSTRRTIYAFINRLNPDPTLRAFDAPGTGATADRRTESIVPQQSLFALNSPFVIKQATELIEHLQFSDGLTPDQRVDVLFQHIHHREAHDVEQKRIAAFLALMQKRQKDPWPLLAQSLLTSNELLYVD